MELVMEGFIIDGNLEKILGTLNELNSDVNIFSEEDLKEQYENIDDFRVLTRELEDVLNDFDSLDENDGDKIEVMLFEFHRILTTFEWHFSEISDLNMKFLKGFRKG